MTLPRELSAILRTDLCCFIQKAFNTINPATPYKHNWHIDAIAYYLNEVLEGRITRLIINIQPRSLKSLCASVAFPAYVLGKDPSKKLICVSYSGELTKKLALDFRAIMHAPWYQALFPRTRIANMKDTELEVMTTMRGSRLATSVGGTLTGRGGDILILDDPMKPEDAYSEVSRNFLKQWYENTLFSRLDDKSKGAIIIVAQRLHYEDLVGHVTASGEPWIILNFPAIAIEEQSIPMGHGRFHIRRPGDLLQPDREPMPILDEIRRTLGSQTFSAQYQQDPLPADGSIIKWSWFQKYDVPFRRMPGDLIFHSWDTASKANELADYSVCTVWAVRGKVHYLLDVFRDRLEYPALKKQVAKLANRDNPHHVLIEDKGSGIALLQDLRSPRLSLRAIKPEKDKVTRMSSYSAMIEGGEVYLPNDALWLRNFRSEILQFPHGKFDDQVDSLSQFLFWMRERHRRRVIVVKTC